MGVSFLGYDLFEGDVAGCAESVMDAVGAGTRDCKVLACLNPHSYAEARNDTGFKGALCRADWLVPDGSGVVIGAKILGLPIRNRVAGPDVFLATLKRLNATQGSVFFLGSSERTLAAMEARIGRDYPELRLVGTYSPPFAAEFTDQENDAMIAAVNRARPDILWVGMTAPKQEKWLDKHRDRLDVAAAGAIGAAFDFFAGEVNRSPMIFRRMGLEWLPRLLKQPRRLWRRMGISAPIFLADVLCTRIVGARRIPIQSNKPP